MYNKNVIFSNIKEGSIKMKIKFLAVALILSLCFSACSQAENTIGAEDPSTVSSTPYNSEESETPTEESDSSTEKGESSAKESGSAKSENTSDSKKTEQSSSEETNQTVSATEKTEAKTSETEKTTSATGAPVTTTSKKAEQTTPAATTTTTTAYVPPVTQQGSLYDLMMQYISEGQAQMKFYNVSAQEVQDTFLEIMAEHPEFFWFSNSCRCNTTTYGSQTEVTLIPYSMDMSGLDAKRQQFNNIVNDVVSQAKKKSNDFDKLLFIHDYIVDHCKYDTQSANLALQGNITQQAAQSGSAYGCLVAGKAVCSGYAAAFQLLAQKLGYDCGRVHGDNHEWNYVCAGGDYYYVDTTWDDPVTSSGADVKRHEFFCINEKELLLTHTIERGQQIPACNGEKLDYYKYQGLYLSVYSFDGVKKIYEQKGKPNLLELKFGSTDECQKAYNDLYANWYNLFGSGSIMFSKGTSGLTMTMTFSA